MNASQPSHRRSGDARKTRFIKMNATTERPARAMFSSVKPPNPKLRVGKSAVTRTPKP